VFSSENCSIKNLLIFVNAKPINTQSFALLD
jgi:hypothetical protein